MTEKELLLIYENIVSPWVGAMAATIVPYIYQGPIAGNELQTYDVNKCYIGATLELSMASGAVSASATIAFLYDFLNVASFSIVNESVSYDTTAALMRYLAKNGITENFYCSRITAGNYAHAKFIGYRITRA